jgi:hypothetical protein
MADVVTEARQDQHATAGTAAFVVGLCCAGVVFLFLWVPLIWAMFGRLALRSVRCGWSAIFAAIARALHQTHTPLPLRGGQAHRDGFRHNPVPRETHPEM